MTGVEVQVADVLTRCEWEEGGEYKLGGLAYKDMMCDNVWIGTLGSSLV